ncbi:hypothetical protein [Lacticaseibacillus absianus]|uniref:hypothetical protein n=1 Tax=Lacticaseibacillus absianus TaxID=2729623 RepID=UPI0015CBF4D9|nr:hypothetical protein [Lacticaseibacillus absianus]
MRVIDLLALLSDYNQNTPVQMATRDGRRAIARLTLDEVLEEPRLILHPQAGGHPHKLWELAILLDRPDLRLRYVYLEDAPVRPAFGVQLRDGALVLN